MRRFPFGALSSSENLEYYWTTWPCAEREAPYANSLPGAGGFSMDGTVPNWDSFNGQCNQ